MVYIGHWDETLHYYDAKTKTGKFVGIRDFFGLGGSQMTSIEARTWLQKNHIGIVIYGEYEQRFGATLPLAMPVIKEFPGTNGLPGTILFDATAVYPKR